MPVTHSGLITITSDTDILAVGTNRHQKTILSDAMIAFTTVTETLISNTIVVASTSQTILSDSKIIKNPVELVLVKESAPGTPVGTLTNPIEFDSAIAGQTNLHPDNPFLLYNDQDGSEDSVDAANIGVEILEMNIIDEILGSSDGSPSQVFNVAFPPIIKDDPDNTVKVKVGSAEWSEVDTFAGAGNSDEIFVVDYVNGTITFGNDVNGAIPPITEQIFCTYTPNITQFGVEARDDGWFGIQSTDVDRNDRIILLDPTTVIDTTHVQASHIPLIATLGVQGVWLITDPNRLGTNYFTSGSYDDETGIVILGTALPLGTTRVYMDYTYTIADDAEALFSQLSKNVRHTFANPIPSKNAKKLNFQLVIPVGVSPTNLVRIKIRLRFFYTEV